MWELENINRKYLAETCIKWKIKLCKINKNKKKIMDEIGERTVILVTDIKFVITWRGKQDCL